MLTRGRAGTGRVNLHAGVAGLFERQRRGGGPASMHVHESLTPRHARRMPRTVAPRDMVATVKVIPFAVTGEVLDASGAPRAPPGPRAQPPSLPPPPGRAGADRASGAQGKHRRGHHRHHRGARGCASPEPWPPPLRSAACRGADRRGAHGGLLDDGAQSSAGRRRFSHGGPARRRSGRGGAGRRRDRALRHACRSGQPDLRRPHRRGAGAGAAGLRALARGRTASTLVPAAPLRRPCRWGRPRSCAWEFTGGLLKDTEARPLPRAPERQRPEPEAPAGQAGRGDCAGGRPVHAAWRPTTSCWWPTGPASRYRAHGRQRAFLARPAGPGGDRASERGDPRRPRWPAGHLR